MSGAIPDKNGIDAIAQMETEISRDQYSIKYENRSQRDANLLIIIIIIIII